MHFVKFTFLGLFIALAAALLLFGPRTASEKPAGRTVITYWEKWTGREGEEMEKIVNDFNDTVGKEKGIFVQYLSVSSINQKTLVSIAGGVPPDVAGVWDAQVVQYAALDAVEPLDELAKQYGIKREDYKPVYWDACTYGGKLWAMISTPATIGLHYNKRIFQEKAGQLRAAGCDPDRAPRTIEELDRYAKAIDTLDEKGRIICAGYVPMEPGWYVNHTAYWFGSTVFDEQSQKFNLLDPRVLDGYEWIRSYSLRLGTDSMRSFKDAHSQFDSAQNAFLAGTVAMVQQGPWMAFYLENLKPDMNRWKQFKDMGRDEKIAEEAKLSLDERKANYQWGVAPFPSAVPGQENVSYAGFDVFMIPKGAKHKKEAFEFIAYVSRQDVMEKLCASHCKNSPLTKVSERFVKYHPNPYIDVFDSMAASPNCRAMPQIPIWPEVDQELAQVAQKSYLLSKKPAEALAEAQTRLQGKWGEFRARQAARRAVQ